MTSCDKYVERKVPGAARVCNMAWDLERCFSNCVMENQFSPPICHQLMLAYIWCHV